MADESHRTSASPVNAVDGPETPDIAGIKALGRALRRPASTLTVSTANDPFYVTQARQQDAEWFAALWAQHGVRRGFHLRKIHYLLLSKVEPVLQPDSAPYRNTEECFSALQK